ncbi:MAG: CrcB family protein [Terrimesophilobacter sp.]
MRDSARDSTRPAATTPKLAAGHRWPLGTRHWYRFRGLPLNSDLEVSRNIAGVPVPIRLRLSYIGLAALGGALGTAARFGLVQIAPTWETLSAGTVTVNLLGPFFLGLLLQSLAIGAESNDRRTLRLLVGTGFLGAFTSYAQLAVDTIIVAQRGHLLLAGSYAVATIAAGAAATWLGIFVASHRWSPRNAHRTAAGS